MHAPSMPTIINLKPPPPSGTLISIFLLLLLCSVSFNLSPRCDAQLSHVCRSVCLMVMAVVVVTSITVPWIIMLMMRTIQSFQYLSHRCRFAQLSICSPFRTAVSMVAAAAMISDSIKFHKLHITKHVALEVKH